MIFPKFPVNTILEYYSVYCNYLNEFICYQIHANVSTILVTPNTQQGEVVKLNTVL